MRRPLGMLCLALVAWGWNAVSAGQGASAADMASCEFRSVRGILLVAREASSYTLDIRSRGEDILVDDRSCGATVRNTDSIRVFGRTRADAVRMQFDHGGFAPGRTPEPDGTSEIEILLMKGDRRGMDTLYASMTKDDDTFAARPDGVDLNGDGDTDLEVRGRVHLGGLSTLGGSDTVTMAVDEASGDSLPFSTVDAIELGWGADEATFIGTAIGGDPVHVWGAIGDDSIRADTGEWTFIGGNGEDALTGGSGEGSLDGGNGDDLLAGGSGDDEIVGGAGDDVLSGGAGDDVLGEKAGEDVIRGDAGADIVRQSDTREQPDSFSGGSGVDRLFFNSESERNLWVSFDGSANDGARGEHDNVAADFEDVLTGYGNDVLVGDDHGQRLAGNKGNDTIIGGGARDAIYGMLGRDEITGGPRRDILDGGKGDDVFHTADGTLDRVWGGNGEDTAVDRDTIDHLHQIEAF